MAQAISQIVSYIYFFISSQSGCTTSIPCLNTHVCNTACLQPLGPLDTADRFTSISGKPKTFPNECFSVIVPAIVGTLAPYNKTPLLAITLPVNVLTTVVGLLRDEKYVPHVGTGTG